MVSHKRTLPQCPRTRNTATHSIIAPPSPSHLAHTAQLGRLGKQFTDNETAQLTVYVHQAAATYVTTNPKHPHYRAYPPRFTSNITVESSKITPTCAARPSSIFHLFSHTTPAQRRSQRLSHVSPRVDSISRQHPEHPHASQAATSPTELSRHLSALMLHLSLRHGRRYRIIE